MNGFLAFGAIILFYFIVFHLLGHFFPDAFKGLR